MRVFGEITHFYISYCQLSPSLCWGQEGVFTNKQYRLDCRISIKMASQPYGGTIANTVRVFTARNKGLIIPDAPTSLNVNIL